MELNCCFLAVKKLVTYGDFRKQNAIIPDKQVQILLYYCAKLNPMLQNLLRLFLIYVKLITTLN